MRKLAVFTAWLLIAVTLLLCGCTPADDSGVDTTPAAVDTTTPVPDAETTPAEVENEENKYTLTTKEGSDFLITRSEFGDQMLTTASIDLKNAIEEKFSASPVLKTDWSKNIPRNEYAEVAGKEILIGHTNRVESRDALAELAEESFVIKWIGEKLVIVGSDDYATKNAVTYFIENYVKTATGDELVIPADTNYIGKASLRKIDMAEGSELRIMTFNIAGTTKEYDGRKDHIVTTILDYLPDVVGFQEANKANHSDILRSSTIAKYYGMNKVTHGTTSTVNYTPILYLKSKYKQVEGGVEWLKSRYEGTNTKSMSWTVLERLSDGKRFIVVNIHGSLWSLDYNLPAGETHESMQAKAAKAWKEDNAKQMIDKITELQGKYGNIAAFTTGDYNFPNSHSAYKIMQSTGLKSAQDTAASVVKGASYHSTVGAKPSSDGLAIDHIFYSPDIVTPIKHFIGKRQSDLDASDHCPVYTDFAFK